MPFVLCLYTYYYHPHERNAVDISPYRLNTSTKEIRIMHSRPCKALEMMIQCCHCRRLPGDTLEKTRCKVVASTYSPITKGFLCVMTVNLNAKGCNFAKKNTPSSPNYQAHRISNSEDLLTTPASSNAPDFKRRKGF